MMLARLRSLFQPARCVVLLLALFASAPLETEPQP